ncbi:MAG: nuclear transport factor 2 family protein [Myxococcota bacterium]
MFWTLFTVGLSFADAAPEMSSVTAPLQAWATATEAGDADALGAVFHPDALQIVRIGDKTMTLALPAYQQMMRSGKVGGQAVSLSVNSVSVSGDVASVTATRQTPGMTFYDAVSLTRSDDDGWRIAGVAVAAVPK